MVRMFLYTVLALLIGLGVAAQTSTPAAVKSGIQKNVALHADHIVPWRQIHRNATRRSPISYAPGAMTGRLAAPLACLFMTA